MSDSIQRVPDLRGQLRGQLERRLRLGIYPEDVKLMEHSVAREFTVSRTPAREALAMLAREGLLERVGRGYRRARFSVQDIKDLFEARRQLEPYAAGLVAQNASPAERVALRESFEALERQVHSAHGYMEALGALRRPLFEPSRNEHLVRLMTIYESPIGYVRTKTLLDLEIRELSLAGNRRLVDAVCEGDQEQAHAQMLWLLDAAEKACTKVL